MRPTHSMWTCAVQALSALLPRVAVPSEPASQPGSRGVCRPVLLGPADLMAVHPCIDMAYIAEASRLCRVCHDPTTGRECDEQGQPRSARQRAESIAQLLDVLAPSDCVTVLVTHGSMMQYVLEALLRVPKTAPGYAEVAELWRVGDDWRLHSLWTPVDTAEAKRHD
jgi:hypothetical protein